MILLSVTPRRAGATPALFAAPDEAILHKTISSLEKRLGGKPRIQFLDAPTADLPNDVLVQILPAEEVL